MKSERTPGKGLWAGGTPALGTSVGVMLHHAGLSPCRADMGVGELPVQQLPNSEASRTTGDLPGNEGARVPLPVCPSGCALRVPGKGNQHSRLPATLRHAGVSALALRWLPVPVPFPHPVRATERPRPFHRHKATGAPEALQATALGRGGEGRHCARVPVLRTSRRLL